MVRVAWPILRRNPLAVNLKFSKTTVLPGAGRREGRTVDRRFCPEVGAGEVRPTNLELHVRLEE